MRNDSADGDYHSTPPEHRKTRLAAGSGWMLDRFSARRSAVNRSPAFERFVFSGSPIRKFRVDHDIRFEVEGESGLVLETNVNKEVLGGNVQFDTFNGFASGLRKRQNAPVGFISCCRAF